MSRDEDAPRYAALDLGAVRRFPFAERPTKVDASQLGGVTLDAEDFGTFFQGLPDILVSRDLKHLARHTAEIIAGGRKVVVMMGAHLIKTGVSPLLIELVRRGAVHCLALNGAGVIHDLELAAFGRTSEDVATHLETGRFGFVEETPRWINEAVSRGHARGWGYGEAMGRWLAEHEAELQYPQHSLVLAAWRHGVPLTVHVAPGTETIHQHPEADGAAIGATSYRDFRVLAHELTGLDGGIVLLYGSAVILPEVFLKALTVVRNLGHPVRDFTAVNFDMIRHYRPHENVVSRPTRTGGSGFTVIGHHELMIPLFWQGVFHHLRQMGADPQAPAKGR